MKTAHAAKAIRQAPVPKRRTHKPAPAPRPQLTYNRLAIAAPALPDRVQREMIDEYGELSRQVQMFEPVQARFDLLKHAIKSWFDNAPADAEASVEGKVYLLNISARQRVRRIRDMKELCGAIGVDELLALASVPLGPLEELIGKTRVDALVADERTGVRRIRAVAKCAAGG